MVKQAAGPSSDGGTAASASGPASASVSQEGGSLQNNAHRAVSLGHSGGIQTSTNILALLDAFFKHVYPLPSYGFLHPRTTMTKFADGTIEKSLVNAIAAVASVRAPGVQRCPSLESAWVQEAETLVWQHLESPTVSRLQAMLLVILYRAETGQLRRAFMLASLAGRTAMVMLLNHERPGTSSVSLEVRRRLLWSLKLVERYFSVGLPEFELCPVENIYIQLPCSEKQFGDRGIDSDDDRGAYQIGIKLEMFRRDVMKLNRSLALCDQPFPQLTKLMSDFQQHLDRIGSQMPDGPEPTETQLVDSLKSRWLPRLLLRNFRTAAPRFVVEALDSEYLTEAELLCTHHAKMVVHVIDVLDRTLGRGVKNNNEPRLLEFDTAICAYTASRILLFTARFGTTAETPTEDFALRRAEMCLSVIHRFFARSMLVRPIVDELRRLIQVFVMDDARAPPSRFSSPMPPPSSNSPVAQLSSAARIRQRLAVHSLLRQAKFVDEDEDDDVGNTNVPYPPIQQQQPSPANTGSASTMSVLPSTEFPPQTSGSSSSGFNAINTGQGWNVVNPYVSGIGSSISPPMTDKEMADDEHEDDNEATLAQQQQQQQQGNDPWKRWFFDGGSDSLPQQDGVLMEAVPPPQGAGLSQKSFTFPWLQREESDLIPHYE
ncbi:Fungal specific transcription factor domain [Geosmithia morbida]|uniref:Fungal specific transcription factor domain n=1 Tax=Geosmithia morbida TaxID=1094350 RepID=A0A9P4YRE4_9HYPO|nr:Fungal specific transcription factor domain [Geosmithia morbida]KAF4120399.1 Fungal specific transcription factor domain [Geosmithia morbida]